MPEGCIALSADATPITSILKKEMHTLRRGLQEVQLLLELPCLPRSCELAMRARCRGHCHSPAGRLRGTGTPPVPAAPMAQVGVSLPTGPVLFQPHPLSTRPSLPGVLAAVSRRRLSARLVTSDPSPTEKGRAEASLEVGGHYEGRG